MFNKMLCASQIEYHPNCRSSKVMDVAYLQTSPLNLWSPLALSFDITPVHKNEDSKETNEDSTNGNGKKDNSENENNSVTKQEGSVLDMTERNRFMIDFAEVPFVSFFSLQQPTEAQSRVPRVDVDASLDEWVEAVREHMARHNVVKYCGPIVANHLLRLSAPADEITRARMDMIPVELHDYEATLAHFVDFSLHGDACKLNGIKGVNSGIGCGVGGQEDKAKALHQLRALFFDPKGTFCGWRDRLKLLLSRAEMSDDGPFECAQIAHSFRFIPDLQKVAYKNPQDPAICYKLVEEKLNEMKEAGTLRLIKPSSTSPPLTSRGLSANGMSNRQRGLRTVRQRGGFMSPGCDMHMQQQDPRRRRQRPQWAIPGTRNHLGQSESDHNMDMPGHNLDMSSYDHDLYSGNSQ